MLLELCSRSFFLSPPVALSARAGSHPDTRGPRASV
jgi:hypothetical protein